MQLQAREFKWGLNVNKWSDVKCSVVMWSELTWFMWSDFILKWSEVKWVTVKLLGMKVPCTLGWSYTEGTWLYCDYFILEYLVLCFLLTCTVVVLTRFVMCGCFGNVYTCIYCVLYCLYCVFVMFRLCIFILFCFAFTSVRTTATQWKLNCS